ncbi:MAG: isopeptide-forming domain-containing fimbrial protein [Oscillospiraceae bacterium]|nr:isopeptide-forming domain-containing fimbrial protein [Oscillospiraceae bacterium]
MRRKRKIFVLLSIILSGFLLVSFMLAASAAELKDFPLVALNGDLVANENTQFIMDFAQDPTTMLITASVKIINGNTGQGASPIRISGASFEISFDARVAPYRFDPVGDAGDHVFDPARLYHGALNIDENDLRKYCFAPISGTPTEKFDVFGSHAFRNDANGRFIGATVTAASEKFILSIAPGQTATVAQVYFMPIDGKETLDIEMFRFEFLNNALAPGLQLKKLSNWLGNGTYFFVGDKRSVNTSDTYLVNKLDGQSVSQSFKLHILQSPPFVSANQNDRVVEGYIVETMEWSYSENGPYFTGHPVIPDDACMIFVRMAGSSYSGDDAVYGNYKRYIASAPVAVEFERNFISCMDDVSLSKTSSNMTSADGKTHVGDIIRYVIVARNDGHPLSVWADAIMIDEVPEGMSFVGNVTLDNVTLSAGTGFTFVNGVLTVPLGSIPGGTQKVVTFDADVGEGAYGMTILNSVAVEGKDGEGGDDLAVETEEDGGGQSIVDRTDQPSIDEINDGDRVITGTGVPGATIEIFYPESNTTSIVTVEPDGTWSVTVPGSINLVEGETIKAVQTVEGSDPSDPSEAEVQAKKNAIPYIDKKSSNMTSTDGKTRIGDKIMFTITVGNDGSYKSVWTGVVMTDAIPDGVTYVSGSALLDGKIPTYSFYYPNTKTLMVTIGNIPGGTEHIITFEATVDANAAGKHILNSASAMGKDNGGTDIGDEKEDGGGGFTVTDRVVHGYIWPMVSDDLGLDGFGELHAVTIELRPTFRTPADPELRMTSVLTPDQTIEGLSEFYIGNVPLGTYVLHISRPGYLTRAMIVTISETDPDIIELAPPGSADNGIFNLWWGDCNGDLMIESKDLMMIMELMDLRVDFFDSRYNSACDMNADGIVESKDIMMVLEMWNRIIWDYAGAEDVDIDI